jgi:hypothetical protein
MRQAVILTLVVTLTATVLSATAAGEASRLSCPNGYAIYAVPQTEAAVRQFPRIAAGLDADPAPYTVADLITSGNAIDENDDGNFCLKDVSNLRGESGKHWGFFYLARDNDASAS